MLLNWENIEILLAEAPRKTTGKKPNLSDLATAAVMTPSRLSNVKSSAAAEIDLSAPTCGAIADGLSQLIGRPVKVTEILWNTDLPAAGLREP